MDTSRRRAYILLGVIGAMEIAALTVLFAYPSHKPKGEDSTIRSHAIATSTMELTSGAFAPMSSIPSEYTCDGKNTNPPLAISGVPAEAKSLVLILHDPDVPKAVVPDGVFDHWVLYNIPPATTEIAAGSSVGVSGKNGAGQSSYTGPCPPTQFEPKEHRYIFTLYALDQELTFPLTPGKTDVLKAMEGHILQQTEMVGKYQKKGN